MYIHKTFNITIAAFLLVGVMLAFTSCQKKNTSPAVANNTQGGKYYLTGDINGSAFKANLVAAGDTSRLMIVIGMQIINKDSSLIVIIFPDDIPLDQGVNYSSGNKILLAYANSNHPSEADVYATSQTYNTSSGVLTVTGINGQYQTVSGTFTAVATAQSGGSITITNGRFYMPFKEEQGPGLGSGLKY